MITKTKYYGIDIQTENNGYWIVDDYGNYEEFDHYPTAKEIDDYRNRVSSHQ